MNDADSNVGAAPPRCPVCEFEHAPEKKCLPVVAWWLHEAFARLARLNDDVHPRGHLASLEPKPEPKWYKCPVCGCGTGNCTHAKPEPKRGVEYLLGCVNQCHKCQSCEDAATEALRLYREERERVWGIIANAGFGDWTRESQDWQEAAHRWGVENGFRRARRDAD